MQYILIEFDNGNQAYQEIANGSVVRFTDLDGNTVSDLGLGSSVVDANPPVPSWAIPDPVFDAPIEPASRIVSVHAFRSRFTADEKRAIYTAAKTNIDIQIWLDELDTLKDSEIDLGDPETQSAVYALESVGLIGVGRGAEVLNA